MKTKEEILQSYMTMDWPMGMPMKDIYAAMQECSDQENKILKAENELLESCLGDWEQLNIELSDLKEANSMLVFRLNAADSDYQGQIDVLKDDNLKGIEIMDKYYSDLSALKERVVELECALNEAINTNIDSTKYEKFMNILLPKQHG